MRGWGTVCCAAFPHLWGTTVSRKCLDQYGIILFGAGKPLCLMTVACKASGRKRQVAACERARCARGCSAGADWSRAVYNPFRVQSFV
eukprot:4835798-Prymnesium_polylepis.1